MPQELNPNVQFRHLIGDLSDTVDEAILHALESNANDQLLATLAEARGGVVRMTHAVKVVNIIVGTESHNDQLPHGAQPKPLPKVKALPKGDTRTWEKQRPGITKKLRRPRDYACPTCHAEPGTNCFKFTMQGKHGVVTDQRNSGTTYHSARQQLSVTHNERVKREYDRQMNKEHDHGE